MKTLYPKYAFLMIALLAGGALAARGQTATVRTTAGLVRALQRAAPGSTILLAPGAYEGGIWVENLNGAPGAPIVIAGLDPTNPPVFTGGGSEGWHLSDCNFVTLRGLRVSGYGENGINADDGGTFGTPSRHLRFENLTIDSTGPDGNFDALKLSGVDKFAVINCLFSGWGGSAIDMVGCHNGRVSQCVFQGRAGYSQDSGIQLKGGTTNILVTGSFFKNAGARSINLGGSTGLEFFRPSVPRYEAKAIEIAGNRFVGSEAPIAWVTASGGWVHHNTFYLPRQWVMRILQESEDPRFRPCHDGVFEHNLVVFDSRVDPFVNVGPYTRPESFTFRSNAWFQVDGSTVPTLPTPETGGVYQVNPGLVNPGKQTMAITSTDPRLAGIGSR